MEVEEEQERDDCRAGRAALPRSLSPTKAELGAVVRWPSSGSLDLRGGTEEEEEEPLDLQLQWRGVPRRHLSPQRRAPPW